MLGGLTSEFVIIGVAVFPLRARIVRRKCECFGDSLRWQSYRARESRGAFQVYQAHLEGHGNFAELLILDIEVGHVSVATSAYIDGLRLRSKSRGTSVGGRHCGRGCGREPKIHEQQYADFAREQPLGTMGDRGERVE